MGIWLEVLVEQDGQLKGWVFQGKGGYRIRVQDLDYGFQEVLRELRVGG